MACKRINDRLRLAVFALKVVEHLEILLARDFAACITLANGGFRLQVSCTSICFPEALLNRGKTLPDQQRGNH